MVARTELTPSNPNWVEGVTPSPRMQRHLSGIEPHRLLNTLLDYAGTRGEWLGIANLMNDAEKRGVLDTRNPYFSIVLKRYMAWRRIGHPLQTIMELPGLLRKTSGGTNTNH